MRGPVELPDGVYFRIWWMSSMLHGHASICFSFSQNPMEFSRGMRSAGATLAFHIYVYCL